MYTLSERPAEGERLAESKGKETNGKSTGYFEGIRYGIRDRLSAERHRATESPWWSERGKASYMVKGGRCVRRKDRETCLMQKVEPVIDVIRKERYMERHTGEPCAVKVASTVRRGL